MGVYRPLLAGISKSCLCQQLFSPLELNRQWNQFDTLTSWEASPSRERRLYDWKLRLLSKTALLSGPCFRNCARMEAFSLSWHFLEPIL